MTKMTQSNLLIKSRLLHLKATVETDRHLEAAITEIESHIMGVVDPD